MSVGFHPANRDGQPPTSARCESLLGEILDIGFDVEEANTGGVCVESLPDQKRQLQKFNTESCEGDERMAAVVAATAVTDNRAPPMVGRREEILACFKPQTHAFLIHFCTTDPW